VDSDTAVKVAVYRHFADTGRAPAIATIAELVGAGDQEVQESYGHLAKGRLLVLEADGRAIRMAPPFSGVPTQHRVLASGVTYYANCAWDSLGIPAALHRPAEVFSRCEASLEPLRLEVGERGPGSSSWLFHCQVPAAKWWQDIVFT
jgi:hypothetical protein